MTIKRVESHYPPGCNVRGMGLLEDVEVMTIIGGAAVVTVVTVNMMTVVDTTAMAATRFMTLLRTDAKETGRIVEDAVRSCHRKEPNTVPARDLKSLVVTTGPAIEIRLQKAVSVVATAMKLHLNLTLARSTIA